MSNVQVDHVERRLAAILAADVAGYSRLMGVDEEDTLGRMKEHLQLLFYPKITEHRGRVVKTTGDGLLVEFASVIDAVRCAVEVQRGMAERNAGALAEQRIDFRIGINVGDIIIDGNDIYGDGVNVAARLEGLAEPGGICVSRTVRDQVRDKLDFGFEDLGAKSVKNIARPIRVDRIVVDASGDRSAANAPRLPIRAPRSFSFRWALRRTTSVLFRAVRILLVLVVALVVLYRWVMPPITPMMLVRLAEIGNLSHRSVPLEAIAPDLPRALMASEDGRFCQHSGVSWIAGTTGGTSRFLGNAESITMQLAQNLFLWPGNGPVERSLALGLAYAIDFAWPKRRVMEVYLNTAEWGRGVFGAETAAQTFFGKTAKQLSRREAALLVAVLPDPSQTSPVNPTRPVMGRADKIAGKIDASRFDYGCLR
jgi:class 3 adenylate cyclase